MKPQKISCTTFRSGFLEIRGLLRTFRDHELDMEEIGMFTGHLRRCKPCARWAEKQESIAERRAEREARKQRRINETIFHVWDIEAAFECMQRKGIALVRHALEDRCLGRLKRELTHAPFEKAAENIASVKQNFDRCAFRDHAEGLPRLEELRIKTEKMVRLAGEKFTNLANWQAKDILVQRYAKDGYLGGDEACPRPFHRVGGSAFGRYRISATFRDNNAPDRPIKGFSYRNFLEGGE
jgi:hypothetical protein